MAFKFLRTSHNSWLLLILLSLIFPLVASAQPNSSDSHQSNAFIWAQYINSHTTGLISKKAKVRIHFVNDVVGQAKVGKSADNMLKIMPAIKGRMVFKSARVIELTPDTNLKAGQIYVAKLKTRGLAGFPNRLDQYSFSFKVIEQDFEVNVHGLNNASYDDNTLALRGTVYTADTDDTDRIEKLLKAIYHGRPLKIQWVHNVDGRHHDFTIANIRRQAESSTVSLYWDGKFIGANTKGETSIDIPASGDFKLGQIKAVQLDRQYVLIQFSESIDTRQNLNGLIQFNRGQFSSRIEANNVKLYPNRPLTGEQSVIIEEGIKNTKGDHLGKRYSEKVVFSSRKPQVRFVGKGSILPSNKFLSIPFEAMNAHSVQVTAFRIYGDNMGQFLQSNKLGGEHDLHRVGRYLWQKTIPLSSIRKDKWNRYALDATKLLKSNADGMFRLTLSLDRGNSSFQCSEEENAVPIPKPRPLQNHNDLHETETSSWDYAEDYYGINNSNWRDRNNACKDAYYKHASEAKASRNFMASNIGILAKADSHGNFNIITTDLRNAAPMPGVNITLYNFQNQKIKSLVTDKQGFGKNRLAVTPFYLIAEKAGQKGYLKLNSGSVLPISHFDVGGQKSKKGIKGFIYGERGVWRPGDAIYLTFVLQDKQNVVPDQHPVTMRLINPKGQLMQTITNTKPMGDFYTFKLKTDDDAPTGNWSARAQIGGSIFTKKLKIETVIPNRLKVELELGKEILYKSDMPLKGKLFSQWLHGATASELKTDIAVRLAPMPTKFQRFSNFVFDDPTREFSSDSQIIFEGELDDQGWVEFEKEIRVGNKPPGMLKAFFSSRVFEKSGDFSTSYTSAPFAPYENFVGIKLPKGDKTRGMLLTDKNHQIEIATLGAKGKPVSLDQVQVTLYKINWKWWWDKSSDSLAQYSSAHHRSKLQQATIQTKNGRGHWAFDIKYPDWGRYLVRACDLQGNHCTGKVVYIDWPGWAGRAQEEGGPGASVLNFSSDKDEYKVGQKAIVQLPAATQGRALLSIESGSRILEQRWIHFAKGKTKLTLPITKAMSPNIYVSVTLIQPHRGKKNDRPIRLYGVIPIKVKDPNTILNPQIKVADQWEPGSKGLVEVKEQNGQQMTYTLAVVDEGLLGLTRFKTPNLHQYFYRKEALGIRTWDLFDLVVGAYGGELERLLALGGGADEGDKDGNKKKKRFPPVVKFLGPFQLKPGQNKQHSINLPQYVGAVRVMLVAGNNGAYGLTDKSVFVRKPLMLLSSMPRMVGPEEEFQIPVTLFSMEPSIKQVSINIQTDGHYQIMGPNKINIVFNEPGEQIGYLKLKAKPKLGKGIITITAKSGPYHAESKTYMEVRSANPRTTRQFHKVLEPGKKWKQGVIPHGIGNTSKVSIEVSSIPPINLERRLDYLIRYPHGCVEQTTSAAFPQLYLPSLLKLGNAKKDEIEHNVHAAIKKLRRYQHPNGSFLYWPGGNYYSTWANNYVGHFLLEAGKLGYHVPAEMLSAWVDFQKSRSLAWVAGSNNSVMEQTYRLYTLALSNSPQLGAMNRLRESNNLNSAARWLLAGAYQLVGQTDAAIDMVKNDNFELSEYATPGATFGSQLRDRAIILNSLVILGMQGKANEIAEQISNELSTDKWHSTQSVSYSLLAMARYIGHDKGQKGFRFEQQLENQPIKKISADSVIHQSDLTNYPANGGWINLKNTSKKKLFITIVSSGIPKSGEERSYSSGLYINTLYTDTKGESLDISEIKQGMDLVATVTVRNLTNQKLENLALTHIVPSGWQIHNPRFSGNNNFENASSDYQDIRDDRILTYHDMKPDELKRFTILLNASYVGKYYLPSVSVEAMYDKRKQARTKGQWVEVLK